MTWQPGSKISTNNERPPVAPVSLSLNFDVAAAVLQGVSSSLQPRSGQHRPRPASAPVSVVSKGTFVPAASPTATPSGSTGTPGATATAAPTSLLCLSTTALGNRAWSCKAGVVSVVPAVVTWKAPEREVSGRCQGPVSMFTALTMPGRPGRDHLGRTHRQSLLSPAPASVPAQLTRTCDGPPTIDSACIACTAQLAERAATQACRCLRALWPTGSEAMHPRREGSQTPGRG